MPEQYRALLLSKAQAAMHALDLEHMITFDASQAQGEHTVTGNTNLNMQAVQDYFEMMPNTSFWLNGYGATFTAYQGKANGQAVLSFDYYLDPGRSVMEAAEDMKLLAVVCAFSTYCPVISCDVR